MIHKVGAKCPISSLYFRQVPKADIPMADLQERFTQIAGFHFVSSIEGKVSA